MDGAIYFLTWRLAPGTPTLTPDERSIVVDTLAYFDTIRYTIMAYVVMDDHVHVIVDPMPGLALEKLAASWKSYSAYRLQREFKRTGRVWQDESFDRIIRHEPEFEQKLSYVLGNPQKRWPEADNYEWVGCSLEGHPGRGAGR